MSGGAFSYIQNAYASQFLENSALVEEVGFMHQTLADYGPEAEAARLATVAIAERMTAARAQLEALEAELNKAVEPLREVWREVDYHLSHDSNKDDVLNRLRDYNKSVA